MQINSNLSQTKNFTREEALQKIIKNQELTIRELENKLSDKISPLIPIKLKFETDIIKKDKENEYLNYKIQENMANFQNEKQQLTDLVNKSQITIETLKNISTKEKLDLEKKLFAIETTYKNKVILLENEKQKFIEDITTLKGMSNLYNEKKKKMQNDIINFNKLIEDLQRLNDVFQSREKEYKRQTELLKSNLNFFLCYSTFLLNR